MWEPNELLKMMQVNFKIFGDEITHIKDADDKWLINYFEKSLVKLFPPYSFCNSAYCDASYTGKGDLCGEKLRDSGFGLTKEQCAEIGNYIIGKVYINMIGNKPELHRIDVKIILNYIERGYELRENYYRLVYKKEM